MFDRFRLSTLLLALLAVPFIGCGSSSGIDSIQVSPAAVSFTGTGQTANLTATATIDHGSHPATNENVTSLVTWTSGAPGVATVSSTGVVLSVGPGTALITASINGFTGTVTSISTVTVTVAGAGTGSGGAAAEPLVSIAVLPGTITDQNLLGTGQFLAYGTFSTIPTVMDITNGYTRDGVFTPVTWISAAQEIFPITSSGAPGETGGLVTAVGSGTDPIYAVATNPDGTVVISPSATFNCPFVPYVPATATAPAVLGSCNPETIAPGLLVTLAVFNAGLNTTNWLVTAPSATGTPDVIHCGPGWTGTGGSVCTATYPVGTTVTLTAPTQAGVAFGGWSFNCNSISPNPSTAAGPNTCTITLGNATSSNESVGAIFN